MLSKKLNLPHAIVFLMGNYRVACIRDVACAHLGFAPYLARMRCPQVRCVHPSKWPFWLRALVHKKTLVSIRFKNDPCLHPFQVTKNQHLDLKFSFCYWGFTRGRHCSAAKHHPIIRVGAGLIQFVYRSHLRLATEATRNRKAFSPFSPLCPWDTHYQFSIKTLLSKRKLAAIVSTNIHIISIYICIAHFVDAKKYMQ